MQPLDATFQRAATPIGWARWRRMTTSSPCPSPPKVERETALRPASTEMRGKSNLWTLILSAISMLLIAATVPTTGGAEPATGVTNREVTAPIDWANFAYSQCRPPK